MVAVEQESADWWVYFPEIGEIEVVIVQTNSYVPEFHGRDAVMDVPLSSFVVPDACWHAWDLHPGTFDNTGKCAVHMLHESFTTSKRPRIGGQRLRVTGHAMTLEQIEWELDTIFENMGYKEGTYPFERSWREDGCTTTMILEFCKKHKLKCFVHYKKKMMTTYTPEDSTCNTPVVNFTIFSKHCYWYGRQVSEQSRERDDQNMANQAAAQMANRAAAKAAAKAAARAVVPEDDDDDDDDNDTIALDRELAGLSSRDCVPPFSEWGRIDDFWKEGKTDPPWKNLVTKNDLNERHEHADRRRKKACRYYWTDNLQWTECSVRELHEELQNFDFTVRYGQRPDLKTGITLNLGKKIPTIVIKSVPADYYALKELCEAVSEEFGDASTLVYRGESRVQIGERLRLIFSRPRRKHFGDDVIEELRKKQNNKCADCRAEFEDEKFEVDHDVPLCDGGADDPSNLQLLCVVCHRTKTTEERQNTLYTPKLTSRMNRDLLEGFLAAPKPRQVCWYTDDVAGCVAVDAIRSRTHALTKNTVPLPIFLVTDDLKEGFEPGADFYFVDAGEITDGHPLNDMPYMGPGWYWRENFQAMVECNRASHFDVKGYIKAGEHAPGDSLSGPFEAMENFIVETLIQKRLFEPKTNIRYTEETARPYAKAMLLAVQGSWTQQHHYSWKCVSSTMPEDAYGTVHQTMSADNGVTKMMSRTERLSCTTMYPIGLIALNKEHLNLYKLSRAIQAALHNNIRFIGINVDCLYVKATRLVKKTYEELDRVVSWSPLLQHPDGSPIFRVEKIHGKNKLHDVQALPWAQNTHDLPILSPWKAPDDDDGEDGGAEVLIPDIFGWWLQTPPLKRKWRKIYEEDGVGCGADDTYQAEVVELIVKNKGGFVVGRGGTGKSKLITGMKEGPNPFKGLVEVFTENKYEVYVVALTHTAVANVATAEIHARTLLSFLHQKKQQKKLMAVIIDECSQIPLSMQSVIMELKFMGHVIVQMGDPHGQFLPIPDRNRHHMIEHIDESDVMHDMCNGLHITLRKFRRGADMRHFDFVGSLYWKDIEETLGRAIYEYELTAGGDAAPLLNGVTLVVSHKRRHGINHVCNARVKPDVEEANRFVVVDATVNVSGPNQPQSMWLHRGLILQACTKKTEATLRNGMRYLLVDFEVDDVAKTARYKFEPVEEFGHKPLDDYTSPIEPRVPNACFWMSERDVLIKMRLTFAVTYFSAQAATIRQPLRLEDTKHKHFTTRHLIVGLGRAPLANRVQLCGRLPIAA